MASSSYEIGGSYTTLPVNSGTWIDYSNKGSWVETTEIEIAEMLNERGNMSNGFTSAGQDIKEDDIGTTEDIIMKTGLQSGGSSSSSAQLPVVPAAPLVLQTSGHGATDEGKGQRKMALVP